MSIFLRRCMFFSCAVFLIFSEIIILESYAAPAPPLGYSTGGLFADYFQNAVNNDCLIQEGYTMRGFLLGNDYMKPDCIVGLWQSNGIDKSWSKRQFNGIGIANPLYTLDVAGNIRFDLPGASSSGQILMGDASGALSWAPIPATCIPGGTGKGNICQGLNALKLNTSGYNNVGFGSGSLFSNLGGARNIAIGNGGLYNNTSGSDNIAIGNNTLSGNTIASSNLAIGTSALQKTTASYNIGLGHYALSSNVSGYDNIAIGVNSLLKVIGSSNVALGRSAGGNLGNGGTTDSQNTFLGSYSAQYMLSGSYNTFLGAKSAYNLGSGSYNTFLGRNSGIGLTYGNENTFVGNHAGKNLTSGSFNIAIGTNAILPSATGSSQLNIGGWIYGISGNIGIGTSNPKYKLDVAGSANLVNTAFTTDGIEVNSGKTGNRTAYIDFHGDDLNTDYALRISRGSGGPNTSSWIQNKGTGAINIQQLGAGNIAFATNGYNRLVVSSGGNIGINTSSPLYKLDVAGDIINNGWYRSRGNTGWKSETYGGGIYMQDPTWIRTSGDKSFYHNTGVLRTDGILQVGPNGGTFIATTGGNVGIGINTPSTKLHVKGGDIEEGDGTSGFLFHSRSSNSYDFLQITSKSSGNYEWGKGITLVRSTGNVGIGNTIPGAKFDIGGNGNGNIQAIFTRGNDSGFQLQALNRSAANTNGSLVSSFGVRYGTNNTALIDFYRGAGAADGKMAFVTNNTTRLFIENNGNIGIGTTATPGAKLEVAGQVKITGGTPGAGKVLTSDATGLASWQSIAAGGGNVTIESNAPLIHFIETDKAAPGKDWYLVQDGGDIGFRVDDTGNFPGPLTIEKDGDVRIKKSISILGGNPVPDAILYSRDTYGNAEWRPQKIWAKGCGACPNGYETYITYPASGNMAARRCRGIIHGGSRVATYNGQPICRVRGNMWDNKILNPGVGSRDLSDGEEIDTYWYFYDEVITGTYNWVVGPIINFNDSGYVCSGNYEYVECRDTSGNTVADSFCSANKPSDYFSYTCR